MKITLDSPTAWIVLAIGCVALILIPIQLRRHWKDIRSAYGDWYMSAFWYRSDEFRRGHVRATPIVMTLGYSVALFGILLYVIPPVAPGNIDWPASIGATMLLACFVVAVPLYWSVVLFNKPKFVVAPRFRRDPGALEERRTRRRSH